MYLSNVACDGTFRNFGDIPQISLALVQELLSCCPEGNWKWLLEPSYCGSKHTVQKLTAVGLTLKL